MKTNTVCHRGRVALSALSLGIVVMLPTPCLGDNPIVQTNFTADPAPMVYDGRLYLYTSHDEDVTINNFFTMNEWRLYSTIDMVNWTDHGSPASLETFSWSTDNAWAPQAVERDGTFYLYVPINNNTGAKIGVCTSTNPWGPFTDPIGRALAQEGAMAIDPTVFVDDDGQAYLYWGNGNLRFVRLNSDMISTSGNVTSNVDMQGFTEGPWFYKRESLYYLVYAGSGEKISYATSNSPEGPWTFKGDIMGNPSIGTNHPGVVDYKGHSYLFYHNGALSHNDSFKRSVCVEEFTYGADGSIPRIEMTDNGPSAVATLNPFEQVEAETIANSSGLKTEVCTDTGGGMNVTNIHDGDYIKVKDVDFLDGVTSFDARVSSAGGTAQIELHLDSESGPSIGTCDVSGASEWTTKTCPVSGEGGTHDLYLKFKGGGGELFKFNWWKFTGPTDPQGQGGSGAGGEGAGGNAGSDAGGVAGGGAAQQTGGDASGAGGTLVAGGEGNLAGGSVSGGQAGTENAGGIPVTNGGAVNAGGQSLASGGAPGSGGTVTNTGGLSVDRGGNGSHVGGGIPASGGSVLPGTGGFIANGGASTSGGQVATVGGTGIGTGGGAVGAQGPAVAGTDGEAVTDGDPDSGSCSCRVDARRGDDATWVVLCGVALAMLRRRRATSSQISNRGT